MYLDKNLCFSDAQAITSGTANSTNIIDLGAQGSGVTATGTLKSRIGSNGTETAGLVINTKQVFAGGTSVAVELQTADDEAFSVNVTSHGTSAAVATAALTANTKVTCDLKLPVSGCRRFVRLRYVAVGTFTTGTIVAHLAPEGQENQG
jgi:hypothetical protein